MGDPFDYIRRGLEEGILSSEAPGSEPEKKDDFKIKVADPWRVNMEHVTAHNFAGEPIFVFNDDGSTLIRNCVIIGDHRFGMVALRFAQFLWVCSWPYRRLKRWLKKRLVIR